MRCYRIELTPEGKFSIKRLQGNARAEILNAWAEEQGPGWKHGVGALQRRPLVYHVGYAHMSKRLRRHVFIVAAQSNKKALEVLLRALSAL